MTPPNPHAALLELLETRWPERVPCSGKIKLGRLHDSYAWIDFNGQYVVSDNLDAHVHIERAAWRVVREWCKARGTFMLLSDTHSDGIAIGVPERQESGLVMANVLGSGATDADALLACLTGLAERGETHG